MREIRFRAVISENTTVYFTLADLASVQPLFSIKQLVMPWLRRGNIPDAYTGLKDKKGVEIYEGDRIQFLYNRKMREGVIAWGLFGFWIEGWGNKELYHIEDRKVEVIGNIHENPMKGGW